MPFHNMHSHIFTMNNAPRKFLSLYMPDIAARAINTITSTQAGSSVMKFLLNKLGGNGGRKYASFLEIGKSSGQMKVFRDLLEQYEDSSMKITALTLYMEKLGAEQSLSGFEGQLEEIINVKKSYPDRLLVFFGVDPRWKATGGQILDTVKSYFNKKLFIDVTRDLVFPFNGIKLYPSTGFYAFDEKLRPLLEWAAENGVPIVTHCSYLGGIFNNDRDFLNSSLGAMDPYSQKRYPAPREVHKIENNLFKRLISTQKAANNKYYCSYFLEPASYRSLLNYYKGIGTPLKICFAHFGGEQHIIEQHKIESGKPFNSPDYYGVEFRTNWCAQIQELMLEFDSVYTDVSYAFTDRATHDFIFNEVKNKSYKNRILFGTDFYMTEREGKEKDTYSYFKKKAMLTSVTNDDGTSTNAWQLMAGDNVEKFLASTYYKAQ